VWLDAAIVIAGLCLLIPVRAKRGSAVAAGSHATLTP
jgi:transposase-like protein